MIKIITTMIYNYHIRKIKKTLSPLRKLDNLASLSIMWINANDWDKSKIPLIEQAYNKALDELCNDQDSMSALLVCAKSTPEELNVSHLLMDLYLGLLEKKTKPTKLHYADGIEYNKVWNLLSLFFTKKLDWTLLKNIK